MRSQLDGKDYVEQYVHSLTHELKSPVSAIKGAAEIITPQMEPDQLQNFLSNINDQTDRIDLMINRLLELATLEKRESLTQIDKVDLNQLIDQVLINKQQQIRQKNLLISLQGKIDTKIHADSFLLLQAVDNLLENAIDFSPEGGPIIITLKTGQYAEIHIEDKGTGIPEFAKQRIFERFYSLPRPISMKKSSGLGLCFVKEIALLHRGTFTIKNNTSEGVTASLTLPLNTQ